MRVPALLVLQSSTNVAQVEKGAPAEALMSVLTFVAVVCPRLLADSADSMDLAN